jgi:hypothetical protein
MLKFVKHILHFLAIIIVMASCSKEAIMEESCDEIKVHRIGEAESVVSDDFGLAGPGGEEEEEEEDISDDDDEEDDDDLEDISDDDDEEDDDESETGKDRK